MKPKKDTTKIDRLIRKYLKVKDDVPLKDSTTIASLGAPSFRVIDLGIAVETAFGVGMSADKALEIKTVGAWRKTAT